MIVYGKNTVNQLIKDHKTIKKIYLQEGRNAPEIEGIAKKQKVSILRLNKKDMDKKAQGGNHQGIIFEIEDYKTFSIEELLEKIKKVQMPLLVMLDGLEDPHNLGAILRTCDAIGANGIIIGKHRSVGLTPTVAKVSTGAINTIPVAQVTNLTSTLKSLKQKGYWVVGTDMNNAKDYREITVDVPLVIVVGSEGFGVSKLVKSECDYCVKLPMVGAVSSLNASVACGILLYEIYAKRHPLP